MITTNPGSPQPASGLSGFSTRQKLLLLFAGWTLLGLSQAARLYYWYNSGNECLISWGQAIVWALLEWYLWAGFSWVIFHLTTRLSYDRKFWLRSTLVHLCCAIVISLLHLLLYTAVFRPLGTLFWHQVATTPMSFFQLYLGMLTSKLHGALLTYMMIAFVCYAINYNKRFRDEEHRLTRAEARLAEARLDALKMQLHPHFLFNTLNTIASKNYSDPRAANRMIAGLSDLLRITLEYENVHEVPLREELGFLDRYLDIQQIRFTNRLQVRKDIAPETLDAYVPNLILQPLVENAIQYGTGQRLDGGAISISARREGEYLLLEVRDNGPGVKDDEPIETAGRGLANTRKRLRQLYGANHRFDFQNNTGAGVAVIIAIPYRVQSSRQTRA